MIDINGNGVLGPLVSFDIDKSWQAVKNGGGGGDGAISAVELRASDKGGALVLEVREFREEVVGETLRIREGVFKGFGDDQNEVARSVGRGDPVKGGSVVVLVDHGRGDALVFPPISELELTSCVQCGEYCQAYGEHGGKPAMV